MKNDYKDIARHLGLVIPACILSITTMNAAEKSSDSTSDAEVQTTDNEVVSLLQNNNISSFENGDWMVHTDSHTNHGGNHADRHTDTSHTDKHTNKNAVTNTKTVTDANGNPQTVSYCVPHSDRHNNRARRNEHTNSGNRHHADYHSNRDSYYDCE